MASVQLAVQTELNAVGIKTPPGRLQAGLANPREPKGDWLASLTAEGRSYLVDEGTIMLTDPQGNSVPFEVHECNFEGDTQATIAAENARQANL